MFTPDSQQSDFTQLVVETESLGNRVLQLQAEYTCKMYMDCESSILFLPEAKLLMKSQKSFTFLQEFLVVFQSQMKHFTDLNGKGFKGGS